MASDPVSLREHLEALIAAHDRRYEQMFTSSRTAVDAALSAAKEAVAKAEAASERRFEGVNEFRATLADQQRTLMPRGEQESVNRSVAEKLEAHERLYERLQGSKRGGREMWGYVVAAISVGFGLLSFFIKR